MDRLKTVLAVLKKHHFWVLCGVVVIIGLGLWWIATRNVEQARAERTAQIERVGQQLAQIRDTPDHPNQKVIELTNRRTVELQQQVLKAWTRLYDEQQGKNPLPEILSPEFKMSFDALKRQPDLDIDWRYRQEYMEFIGRHIPKLFEIVDILRLAPVEKDAANPEGAAGYTRPPTGLGGAYPDTGGGGGAMEYDGRVGAGYAYPTTGEGDMGQPGARMIGVVDWVLPDRQRLVQRFNWPTRPTTEQVRLAQEDLWVYEALLRIIRDTNGPVKSHFDAAIQQIQALEIGREAAAAWQGSQAAGFTAAGAGGEGSGTNFDGKVPQTPAPAPAPAPGTPVGEYDGGITGGTYGGQYASLTERRYVDNEGQPLAAGQEPPFAEFNLMPVRMLLVMNQTKLAKLLIECANSNMPVEVRSLRLGMDTGSMLRMGTPLQGGGGGGGNRLTYNTGEAGGGYDGAYQASDRGAYGPMAGSGLTGPAQRKTLYMPVEIQGTICIYNPPDEGKLGTGTAAKTPSEPTPAAAPAAAPAEPPPASPTPTGGAPAGAAAAAGQPPTPARNSSMRPPAPVPGASQAKGATP